MTTSSPTQDPTQATNSSDGAVSRSTFQRRLGTATDLDVELVQPHTSPLNENQWLGLMRGIEISDNRQKIKLRPWLAGGVFALLYLQNIAVFALIGVAIRRNILEQLQPLVGVIVAGTLVQSYYVLRYITNKIFGDITYPRNKD